MTKRTAIFVAVAYAWLSVGLALGVSADWRHERDCGVRPSKWRIVNAVVLWPVIAGAATVLWVVGETPPETARCA